jgi:hypothetical protein
MQVVGWTGTEMVEVDDGLVGRAGDIKHTDSFIGRCVTI